MRLGSRIERRLGFGIARFPRANTCEWLLRQVFATQLTDCVIDVGANVGQFATRLRDEVGYRGQVRSIEPASDTFRSLCAAMGSDPQWTGHRCAVGSKEGDAVLRRYGNSKQDSLLLPSEFGRARHGFREGSVVETVRVLTLEGMWPELTPGASSVFLKIDAQGLDLDILHSAGEHLDEIRGLLIEVQSKPTYLDAPTMLDVWAAANRLGFEECGLFPVARVRGRLPLVTSDLVLVRP